MGLKNKKFYYIDKKHGGNIMNYYLVDAMFGHVGRNKYIIKTSNVRPNAVNLKYLFLAHLLFG